VKAHSEFADVLRQVIDRANGDRSEVTNSDKSNEQAAGQTAKNDCLASINFSWSQSPKTSGWSLKYKAQTLKRQSEGQESENQSSENQSSEKTKVQPKVDLKTLPKRIKRKLTFDQIKSVEVFKSFGETEICDESTIDEIKSAYRRLAKQYHPDAGAKSDEVFKRIAAFYKKLIAQ
jgi:hypothetical protein